MVLPGSGESRSEFDEVAAVFGDKGEAEGPIRELRRASSCQRDIAAYASPSPWPQPPEVT